MRLDASAKSRLGALLIGHAARRLGRKHPEWAAAMASEDAYVQSEGERLRWAAGCAVASYRAPGMLEAALYPAALSLGLIAMTAYQWSADESVRTFAVLGLIGLGLGLLRPHRVIVSGLAVGLVVAAVQGFETVSGVRPAYETHLHTLVHCARWMVLVAPALTASALGGFAGRAIRALPARTP